MKRPSSVNRYDASSLTSAQLRARRHVLRLSRSELARLLHVSHKTLLRWEQGHLPDCNRGMLNLALKELERSLNTLPDSLLPPDYSTVAHDGEQSISSISIGQIHCGLTAREFEVARLVGHGLSNREIAECLAISERTAEGHVERIRGKLGLRSRAALAAWIVRHIDRNKNGL